MRLMKTILLLLASLCLILGGTANARSPRPTSEIGTLPYAALSPEARNTLRLIERGGPFPFHRDGIEFQNRERILPARPRAYYREYTVPTPGERSRGARRIISGADREYYYSADHYRSFQRITLP